MSTGGDGHVRAIALFILIGLSSACMAQGLLDRVRGIDRYRLSQNVEVASLDSICIDVDEWSTDGGTAIGYFQPEGELASAYCWLMGESGKRFQSFHFDRGDLVYSILIDSRYNRPYYWGEAERKENNDTEVFDPAKTRTTSTAYFFDRGVPLCSGPIIGGQGADETTAEPDTSVLSLALSLRSKLLNARKGSGAGCEDMDWRNELMNAPQRGEMTSPDTSLARVNLADQASSIAVLGRIPSEALVEDNMDMPHVDRSSPDGTQFLTFFFHYGDGANSYHEFRLSKTRPTTVRDTLPNAAFRSGHGIVLGMSKADVIAKLGDRCSIYRGQADHELLSYSITDFVHSEFLEDYNMPSYYAYLEFERDRLLDYRFGFEYP